MFANLKNKLIEEVKASPSKIQQLATAAQAAVSSSASTASGSESTSTANATNENFFSITEEDTPHNSPYKPLKLPAGSVRGRNANAQNINNGTGAIPRTRKLSNSSMASDISFRMPTWDAGSSYQFQSDLDESGSEMGDTASTAAKLDVITKEQLFDAYRKSLDRYHKYRCRYTDLAKKYKDLERDSTKARSVLVETQEKAIRRINELREQCSLEQQAKAHLEEALRIEMDDMQCKMQSYQTKLKLLGENPENIATALAGINNEQLIDLTSESTIPAKNKNSFLDMNEGHNEKDVKNEIENFEKVLQERDQQIIELNNKLDLLRKQEEENVLLLAQTKAAIHSELENKESEVKKLGETVKQLQVELQQVHKKEKNSGVTAEELNEVKDKLKQTQMAKQELDAKIIATEHMLQEMREKHSEKEKTYKAIEEQFQSQAKENETKLQELKQQNLQLNEMVTRYQQKEVSLAEVDNELNRTKNENDILKVRITEYEIKLQDIEKEQTERLKTIQQLQDGLNSKEDELKLSLNKNEELEQQLQQNKLLMEEQQRKSLQFENELRIIKEQATNTESDTITNLKMELERVTNELNHQLQLTKEQLSTKEKELKSLTKKAAKNEKQHENLLTQIQHQTEEIEKLKNDLAQQETFIETLRSASQQKEQQMNLEKDELKIQINSILNEISQMEEQMRIVQESHQELDTEKRNLENKIEQMQHQSEATQENSKRWQETLIEAEEKLKACELKLQAVESEHTQLAEKNCLLEENMLRLQKILSDKERQQTESEDALISELRLKLQTNENSLQKLNEKMQEVLDENSRLHNNQELNDHDQRTLQDRYDSLEKEKACLEDNVECLQQELGNLRDKFFEEQQNNERIQNDIAQQQEKLANLQSDLENKNIELNKERALKKKSQQEQQKLEEELKHFSATQNNLTEVNELLKEKQQALLDTQKELEELKLRQQQQLEESERTLAEERKQHQMLSAQKEEQILLLKEKFSGDHDEKERIKEQLLLLREQKESLERELLENTSKLNELLQNQQEAELLKNELEEIKRQNAGLLQDVNRLKDLKTKTEMKIQSQKEELQQLANELEGMRDGKETDIQELQNLKQEIQKEQQEKVQLLDLVQKSQLKLEELQNKHTGKIQELEQLQDKLSKHTSEIRSNDQFIIENEYLNKHVMQLEAKLAKYEELDRNLSSDAQELKEKLKSMQCEMYVFKENAEKHANEIQDRERLIQELKSQNKNLNLDLEKQKADLHRQLEHIKYITEQDDTVQKDLLMTQNKLKDLEIKHNAVSKEYDTFKEKTTQQNQLDLDQIDSLKSNLERHTLTIENLQAEIKNLNRDLEAKQTIAAELEALKITLQEHDNLASTPANTTETSVTSKLIANSKDSENLRKHNEKLQQELEDLKHNSTQEISTLQQEIEDLQSSNKQMTDRIMDLEVLKAGLQAQKLFGLADNSNSSQNINNPNAVNASSSSHDFEKQEMENKLKTIMAEVQDVSNRNLFLEQKCENYLILEQSNERLKLQNAKLSRQLDETLVSMQHNEGISANTEFEYLKNIMFQYLTGSANGNNETLVKVISAVLKFSPQQTQVALEKEHQRRSLINKIL